MVLRFLFAAIVVFPLRVFVPVVVENVPEPVNVIFGFVEVFPKLILVELVFPTAIDPDPPVSIVSPLAPFDCIVKLPEEAGWMVELLNVNPLMEPNEEMVGEPTPAILPEEVKAGSVNPVVATVPLIVGVVNVLFVRVSVVELVINPVLFVH